MRKTYNHVCDVVLRNETRRYLVEKKKSNVEINLYAKEGKKYIYRENVITLPLENMDISDISIGLLNEENNRQHYLYYSYGRHGIYVLTINAWNGILHVSGEGRLVVKRPEFYGDTLANPIIYHNSNNNMYYLFYTCGSDTDDMEDCLIKVGRSTKPEGPFVDMKGYELTDLSDYDGHVGQTVMAPYTFDKDVDYLSMVACSIIENEKEDTIVNSEAPREILMNCVVRNGILKKNEKKTLKLIWTKDNWIVAMPILDKYSKCIKISPMDIVGEYDFVRLVPGLTHTSSASVCMKILQPSQQGDSSTRNDWAYATKDDVYGRVEVGKSMRGFWKLLDAYTLEITYANFTESFVVSVQDNTYITGMSNHALPCYGRKIVPIQSKKPGPFVPPPADSIIGIHDPAIYKDPVTGKYYIYATGAMCHESVDLVRWNRLGRIVKEAPQESYEHVGDKNSIWAPDIIKVNDEYRLYCSNSTWGVRQSCIFLAVSDKPEGPFIPRGCVIKTNEKLNANAIDANLVEDVRTKQQFMVYGSFWGGCHMIELDPATGLAKDGDNIKDGVGTCVARRPRWADCAIEGPYIVYNKETDFYYLYVSYGSLKLDYNIRVGRSKNVTGPFYDINGRAMTDIEDYTNEVGYLLHCGYQYGDDTPFMGPGHNSVLDDDGKWYLVCHIREMKQHEDQMSMMHIYSMLWINGWPVLSPCVYSGDNRGSFELKDIVGEYDMIIQKPLLAQTITKSIKLQLKADNTVYVNNVIGHWEQITEDMLEVSYAGNCISMYILNEKNYNDGSSCIALTGINNHGIACKAIKKR